MRRFLSAVAALVLAFGMTMVGATVANADGPFTSDGMPASVYGGETVTMSGNLPAGNQLEPFDIRPPGSTVPGITVNGSGDSCFGDVSSAAREWSCVITIPTEGLADDSAHDLITNFLDGDAEPQTINSTFTYYDLPSPTISVSSGTTGTSAVGTTVGTLAGAPTGASVTVNLAPDGGSTGSCSIEGSDTECSATVGGSGFMSATTTEDFANPATSTESAPVYFTLPAPPQVTGGVENDNGTVTISGGGGTENDGIRVVDDTGATTCTTTVDGDGDWQCTSTTTLVGLRTYYAFQIDTLTAADYPDQTGDGTYQTGTFSARSDSTESDEGQYVQVWDGLVLPSMKYSFIPGGVVTAATPTGSATKALTELYKWYPAGGSDCSGDPQGESGFEICDYCPSAADDGDGASFANVPVGTSTCTFENLAPGVWNPYSEQNTTFPDGYDGEGGDGEGGGGINNWVDDYFTIPTVPSLTKAVNNANGEATVSGAGIAGDVVHVVADGTSGDVCDAIVADNGTWNCTTGVMPNGSTTFRAYQQDAGAGRSADAEGQDDNLVYMTGGLSAVTADGVVAVITKGSPPTSTVTPPPWTFTLTGIDLTNIHPGDSFTVHAEGLPAGATITVVLHSDPITLGTALVGADGTMNGTYTIPADVPVGAHEIVLTMAGTGLTPTTSVQPVTIVPVAAGGTIVTTEPSKSADDSSKPTAHVTHIDAGDPTAPNILTRSINTIQDVITHPAKISAAVAIGLVLLIFATLPARLLNATIAENYEHLVKRLPRLGRRPKWFESLSGWLKRTPLASGIILSAITAFLFGFADPNFGFTLASLRLIMGLAIALFVVEYLANALTGRIIHKAWSLTVTLNIRPLGLVLTVIGVVASRLLHFSPGFLIGLVLGLVLTGEKAEEDAWKAVLVRSSVVLGFGLIAWLGYSALTTGEGGTATFWNELFVEALVAITTEGIVAILVELLPFRLLEGERLWHRSRILWGVLYFFIIAAFVIAVVPWEGNWKELGSALWVWIGVVTAFAAVCLAVYLYFRFWSPFHETAEEAENEPVDVGAGG
jgi:hypothetical protein